jgi:hypothetical protein
MSVAALPIETDGEGRPVRTGTDRQSFEKLASRMRQGSARAHVLAYFSHRTRPNLIALLEYAAVPEAAPFLNKVRAFTHRHPCRMYTCPVCGKRLKAEAKDQALNRIVQRLGRFPEASEISFVTMNGPQIELGAAEAKAALKRFERKLERFRRRWAPSTSWLGFFDVSLDGVLHWHGLVLHPDLSRRGLVNLLDRSFPGRGEANVRQWNHNHALAENLQNVLNYSLPADRHSRVYTLTDGPDRNRKLVHGPNSAELIAKRIVVVQALAGRGLQGIRYYRNLKVLHPNIKVPELLRLERRTKKRINNKTMLNREWAPRGVLGTHLRGKNPNRGEEREVPVAIGFEGCFNAGANAGTESQCEIDQFISEREART